MRNTRKTINTIISLIVQLNEQADGEAKLYLHLYMKYGRIVVDQNGRNAPKIPSRRIRTVFPKETLWIPQKQRHMAPKENQRKERIVHRAQKNI